MFFLKKTSFGLQPRASGSLRFWSKTINKTKQKSAARKALEAGSVIMTLDFGMEAFYMHIGFINFKTWAMTILEMSRTSGREVQGLVELEAWFTLTKKKIFVTNTLR